MYEGNADARTRARKVLLTVDRLQEIVASNVFLWQLTQKIQPAAKETSIVCASDTAAGSADVMPSLTVPQLLVPVSVRMKATRRTVVPLFEFIEQ